MLCGSGTEALALALRLASRRLAQGNPIVALPAFTCYSVAAAGVCAETRIALYDVDPASLAPDLDSLRAALDAGARIIVASPLFGMPIEWSALEQCAAQYGALVVEDAAQGSGAEWRGRPLGALGEVSVLSFGRGKGWTGGHGGALLTRPHTAGCAELRSNDAGFVSDIRTLLSTAAQFALGSPSLYTLPASLSWLGLGETVYREPTVRRDGAEPWSVRRMNRAAAALVESSADETSREAERRRARARSLLDNMSPNPSVEPIRWTTRAALPGFLRLPVRVSHGLAGFSEPRRALRLGVALTYPASLASLPQVHARLVGGVYRWPGAEELVRQLITLPTHSRITTRDEEALLQMLESYRS